ncbi:MAG: hypothetical protein P9X24_16850 [Candidatus Hatepunaea meridiana]|nr:hypothetical protein [Candidatus Hatepunaea meridiana]
MRVQVLKFILTTLIICFITWTPTNAVALGAGKLSGKFTYRCMYNNNLLHFSSRDRDRFLDNIETYRSPIRTLDDIRSDYKLSISYSKKLWDWRKTQLSITGNFAQHSINPIKNFGWLSITVKQEFTKTLSASINYFYNIDYYIRDYLDVHTVARHSCNFYMDQWTSRLYYRPVKAFEFVGIGRYKKYAYNEYFTEYDSDYIEFGSEVIYRNGHWRLMGGYSFADNQNIGFNDIHSSGTYLDTEDGEEGESDYEQDTYQVSLRYAFRIRGKKSRILLETSLKDRYYITERDIEDDPMHHGRHDVMLSIGISGKMNVNNRISIVTGMGFGNRRSRSLNKIVSLVKDYDSTVYWIESSYDLW